ncbi:MAG: hypothetical protein FK734_01950 [Asgard group archaeon]|nr:hypothetical protein [Asgard group archaeon]
MGLKSKFQNGLSFYTIFLLMLVIINHNYYFKPISSQSSDCFRDDNYFTIHNSEDIFSTYGYEFLGYYNDSYNTNYYPRICYPMNDLVLVAANDTLEIINLENPTSPKLLGTYQANTTINAILGCQNYIFLTKRETEFPLYDGLGVEIIDIQNPANPTLISFFNNFTEIYTLFAISGSLALDESQKILYVVNDGGIGILDVSDATNPILISEIGLSCHWFDPIQIIDSVLYVLLTHKDWACNGMVAWDVSSPSSPILKWNLGGYDSAGSFFVSNNYLYVNLGLDNQSLYIYEIMPDKNISLVASYLCEYYTKMIVKEEVAYICSYYYPTYHTFDYVRVVNVTNKESIEEIFVYNCSESLSKITDINIYSNKFFISETEAGIKYFIIPYCPETDNPYCDFSYTKTISVLLLPVIFVSSFSLVYYLIRFQRKKLK